MSCAGSSLQVERLRQRLAERKLELSLVTAPPTGSLMPDMTPSMGHDR